MKKTFIFFGLIMMSLFAAAQASFVRTALYEEFSSENHPAWFPTNPNLNTVLSGNSTLVIPVTWAVPLPSAPSNTWSLYQTDKAEINWRYRSSSGSTVAAGPSTLAYGYPSQNTPTDVAVNGINSGLTGRLDGQHQWVFGATSDDPADVTNAVIISAQTQTTNFWIDMIPAWNPTFTNCVVSVTVTSSTSFTSVGALMFRLCLIEREVHFATAPGINAEKDFYNVVRKSYPTAINGTSVTAMGTPLNNTWAQGQTQTFTISCNIPNYIHDLSEMAFVGFVQDDGDRKVYQSSRTAQPTIPNDIKVDSLNFPVSCSGLFAPSFAVENLGPVAVSALTIAPYIDGVAQAVYNYSGNIAGGTSATVTLPSYTAAYGAHIFSVTVTGVSGGDINLVNNTMKGVFGVSNNFATGVSEPFNSFPPAGWYVLNYDFTPATWMQGNVGGFGTSFKSAKYDFWDNVVVGDRDDLFLPVLNLSGVANVNLSFDVAYAQSTNQNDKLDVMVSTDCGVTWSNVYSKQGAALSTAPANSLSAFVPAATQWRTESVNLPALANQPSVLIKFVATSDYGNNLYVDNINIGQTTSIGNRNTNIISSAVFPNPASDMVNLRVSVTESEVADIRVVNSTGQAVYASGRNKLEGGINNIALNTEGWPPGIYFVSVSAPGGLVNAKLNVIR